MLLPDHATADALLRGYYDGYRTYGRNYPPIYDEGSRTYVPRNTFVHTSTGQTTEVWPIEVNQSQNMDKVKRSTSAGVDQRSTDPTLPPIRSLPIWGIGNFQDSGQFRDGDWVATKPQNMMPQRLFAGPSPVREQVQPEVQALSSSETHRPPSTR